MRGLGHPVDSREGDRLWGRAAAPRTLLPDAPPSTGPQPPAKRLRVRLSVRDTKISDLPPDRACKSHRCRPYRIAPLDLSDASLRILSPTPGKCSGAGSTNDPLASSNRSSIGTPREPSD